MRLNGALAALLALLLTAGCSTYTGKTAQLRELYGGGRFEEAEVAVDTLIADEAGVEAQVVASTGGLGPSIDTSTGDVLVYQLEKSSVSLALGDAENAVSLMRRGRDGLDENFAYDSKAFFKDFLSLIGDDTTRDYAGADYEHILVRVMLSLADLIAGGGDAYAYAAQVGEKQEEIIGSPLGDIDGEGYRPRQSYSRVSLGAYLQGIIREDTLAYDEAERAYRRALDFAGGDHPLYSAAVERVTSRSQAGKGEGVLHVFYLSGRGPHLVESRANPTSRMVKLAGIAMVFANNNPSLIAQTPVPVPKLQVNDPNPPKLKLESAGVPTQSVTVLDVNQVAGQQLEANLPWTVARALMRRALKATVSTQAGRRSKNSNEALVSILAGVATTAWENADTRSWTSLPAQIQAARLELPAGVREVDFGRGVTRRVRITEGRASYCVVIHPALGLDPVIYLDSYSLAPAGG